MFVSSVFWLFSAGFEPSQSEQSGLANLWGGWPGILLSSRMQFNKITFRKRGASSTFSLCVSSVRSATSIRLLLVPKQVGHGWTFWAASFSRWRSDRDGSGTGDTRPPWAEFLWVSGLQVCLALTDTAALNQAGTRPQTPCGSISAHPAGSDKLTALATGLFQHHSQPGVCCEASFVSRLHENEWI